MTRLIRQVPAKEICWPRPPGPSGRQNYAAVDNSKRYAGAAAGSVDPLQSNVYVWQDLERIGPVLEQPKLILYSAAQPFVRTGHMRRWSRTFMSASARFLGRWAFVGVQQNVYTQRTRMTGVPMRTGVTYSYARFRVSPRTIKLGP
jgi:hypothetical protein